MNTHDEVVAACTRFRAALEERGISMSENMRGFPHGACGDTTEMLGQYLLDCGHGEWMYVTGFRSADTRTHAWLERADVVIDITADQFADITDTVIVSETSTWHGTEFQRSSAPRPANMSFFSGRSNDAEMKELYADLRRRADELAGT